MDRIEPNFDAALESAHFPGARGAVLHRVSHAVGHGDTIARVVLLPGYGDHAGRYADCMRYLARRGVACHALDFRGQGKSDGRRGYVQRWDDYLDDLDALLALEVVRAPVETPLYLVGHSHGGLVAAAAIIRGRVKMNGAVLCAPYLATKFRVPVTKRALACVADRCVPWLRIATGMSDAWITSDPAMLAETRADPLVNHCATPRWFVGMRRVQDEVRRRAGELTCPLMTLVAEEDRIVDAEVIRAFHERAGSAPKTLVGYPNGRHELLRESFRERVFADVLRWVAERD
ncbi:MAG: lysophospholipase [Tepidisphaeraceae bacterium]